jgi:hypothetical protein
MIRGRNCGVVARDQWLILRLQIWIPDDLLQVTLRSSENENRAVRRQLGIFVQCSFPRVDLSTRFSHGLDPVNLQASEPQ